MIEMKKLCALIRRNIKCYFKDKFLFFISLITPMILLALFATFLRSIYLDAFHAIFESFAFAPENSRITEGLAGAWLISSILSVCAVTVAVSSNAVMINDKIDGTINDFRVSPVSGFTLSVSYFIANFIVTLIVMLAVMALGFAYLAAVGWYLTVSNVMMIILDILCCVLFGTLLAGIIGIFISTQGALSAVSSLVSSMYGFICGAYMPLSQFAEGMRNVIGMLPGTYSVGIMRNHFMASYIEKLGDMGLIAEGQKALMDAFDGNLYVGEMGIPLWGMYAILLGACALLFAAYLAIVIMKNKKK
ncbi:MAG: ABC transporter permease [Clostridia bacterium]|nr:ABC transporter permease [Clostridia bacterium]